MIHWLIPLHQSSIYVHTVLPSAKLYIVTYSIWETNFSSQISWVWIEIVTEWKLWLKHVVPKCMLACQAPSLTVLFHSHLLVQPALGADQVCVQSSRKLPSKLCTLRSTQHLLVWVAKQALTVMRWYQNWSWSIKCGKERGANGWE